MPPSQLAAKAAIRNNVFRRVAFSLTWELWWITIIADPSLQTNFPYGQRVVVAATEPFAALAARVQGWGAVVAARFPFPNSAEQGTQMQTWKHYANAIAETNQAAYANEQPMYVALEHFDLLLPDVSDAEWAAISASLDAGFAMDRFRMTVVGEVMGEPGEGAQAASAAMYEAAVNALEAIDAATS